MSADEPEAGEGALATIIDAATGIPLPPVVKQSLGKAIGGLITGMADVPGAWLQGKAQAIRDETAARTAVTQAMAAAAVKEVAGDPQMGKRALHHFGARLLREQKNREAVVAIAAEDLKNDPPTEDAATEVNDDWLNNFSRLAEHRSDQEMQTYFGKILAGEIRRPGSFSVRTLQVMSVLDETLAGLFQKLCSIATWWPDVPSIPPTVFSEPFGSPGSNGLESLGLSYEGICDLQSAGLLNPNIHEVQHIAPGLFLAPFRIGPTSVQLIPTDMAKNYDIDKMKTPMAIGSLLLTRVGVELFPLVHLKHVDLYITRFSAWSRKRLKLAPAYPSIG